MQSDEFLTEPCKLPEQVGAAGERDTRIADLQKTGVPDAIGQAGERREGRPEGFHRAGSGGLQLFQEHMRKVVLSLARREQVKALVGRFIQREKIRAAAVTVEGSDPVLHLSLWLPDEIGRERNLALAVILLQKEDNRPTTQPGHGDIVQPGKTLQFLEFVRFEVDRETLFVGHWYAAS